MKLYRECDSDEDHKAGVNCKLKFVIEVSVDELTEKVRKPLVEALELAMTQKYPCEVYDKIADALAQCKQP